MPPSAWPRTECGSILIMDRERLLGIFTERDLLVRVVATGRNPAETRLPDVMTTDIETIGGDESIEEAIRRMDEGAFRHLPVVDSEPGPGRPLGARYPDPGAGLDGQGARRAPPPGRAHVVGRRGAAAGS